MADGSLVPVESVRKGMQLKSYQIGSDGTVKEAQQPAEIVCVVRTECAQKQQELAQVRPQMNAKDFRAPLFITPYHPCFDFNSSQWLFPHALASVVADTPCCHVYSFLMRTDHSSAVIEVNGVLTVTLAHGITDNAVLSHPYFATQRVVDDLREMQGFQDGLVQLKPFCCHRDESGLVCKMLQS